MSIAPALEAEGGGENAGGQPELQSETLFQNKTQNSMEILPKLENLTHNGSILYSHFKCYLQSLKSREAHHQSVWGFLLHKVGKNLFSSVIQLWAPPSGSELVVFMNETPFLWPAPPSLLSDFPVGLHTKTELDYQSLYWGKTMIPPKSSYLTLSSVRRFPLRLWKLW